MICSLSGEEIEIPDILLQSEATFRDVLNIGYVESITDEERTHLQKFLPIIEDNMESEKQSVNETISLVLDENEKFLHGNPVHVLYNDIKNGLLSPKAVKVTKDTNKLKYKLYKLSQKEYYKNLIEEIIIARQKLLNKYGKNDGQQGYLSIEKKTYPSSDKVQKKFKKILKDIANECGDVALSSDEEFDDLNVDTRTHKGVDGIVQERQYKQMLNLHKRRRAFAKKNPELHTANIKIIDVLNRSNIAKKNVVKPVKLKKKPVVSSTPPQVTKPKSTSTLNTSKSIVVKKKDLSAKKQTTDYPKLSTFFNLIGYLFNLEKDKKATLEQIKNGVKQWQSHKSSELCSWKLFYPDWVPLVSYAFDYMCGKGTSSSLKDFIPLITWSDEMNVWGWNETSYKSNVIIPFFDHWQETLSKVMVKVRDMKQSTDLDRKPVLDANSTQNIVRPNVAVVESPEDLKQEFRKQEFERYKNPCNAFIYEFNDGKITVGPVKGIFSAKDISTSRAREHAMLISDRPPYVTILCLVRDAVARLPNGEGTRGDVSILLKDSQYLNPEATIQQINNVVSGALDRLHAEKDPCVKFEPNRKVWQYLHGSRSVDEFEKLHQASGAAALAKRQLNLSKQKAAAKQKKLSLEIKGTPDIAVDDVSKTEINSPAVEINIETTAKEQIPIPKKKPLKRKKSVADNQNTSKIKVAKSDDSKQHLSETDAVSTHSMEKEALMATQSILNDPADIFGNQSSDTDFLNIGGLSPGLSFDTNLNNVLNDFDENLFSNEKLSLESLNSSSTSSVVSTSSSNVNVTSINTLATSKAMQRTFPQISDILSNKANSKLVPPNNVAKLSSSSKALTFQSSLSLSSKSNTSLLQGKQYGTYKGFESFSGNNKVGTAATPNIISTKGILYSKDTLKNIHNAKQTLLSSYQQASVVGKTPLVRTPVTANPHLIGRGIIRAGANNISMQQPSRFTIGNTSSGNATAINKLLPGIQMKKVSPKITLQPRGTLQNLSQFITTRLPSSQTLRQASPSNVIKATTVRNIQGVSLRSPSTIGKPFISKSQIPQHQVVNVKVSSKGHDVVKTLPTSNVSGGTIQFVDGKTPSLTSIQSLLKAAANKPNVPKTTSSATIISFNPQSTNKTEDSYIMPRQFTANNTQFVAKLNPVNTRLVTQTSLANIPNIQFQRLGDSVLTPVRITVPQNRPITSTLQVKSDVSSVNRSQPLMSLVRFPETRIPSSINQNIIYPRQQEHNKNSAAQYIPKTTSNN